MGSFQLLPIINKATMNIMEHVALLSVGVSSGYKPRSGIAGSSGSIMSNFLRNRQADFQSGFTSLQSHQPGRSVPLSPHPRQHLLSPKFLMLDILTGVRWNLSVVWICISLISKDVDNVTLLVRQSTVKFSFVYSILKKMPRANYLLLKQLVCVLLKIKTSARNHIDSHILSVRVAPYVLWDPTCVNSLLGSDISKKVRGSDFWKNCHQEIGNTSERSVMLKEPLGLHYSGVGDTLINFRKHWEGRLLM